jgi:nucleoside-triphosphatase
MNMNFLFTGPPGCGKSTLIEKIIQEIKRPATGFFTREIREKGRRVGFSINTLAGQEGILAHQDIQSAYRVGRYGVHIEDIDRLAVPSMMPKTQFEVVVIDEIGKMECFSLLFRKTLIQTLDSRNPIIGSISLKGDTFIRRIKQRNDVDLMTITEENREELIHVILEL